MNSLHLGGGKGKFLSFGSFLEAILNTRNDIKMPHNISDRTIHIHKTCQIIDKSDIECFLCSRPISMLYVYTNKPSSCLHVLTVYWKIFSCLELFEKTFFKPLV